MKKFLALLLFFLPSLVFAQQLATGSISASGTTCATTNACIVASLTQSVETGAPVISTASIVVSGTFTGTLQFEVSGDGVNFVGVQANPLPNGAPVTSTTTTGTFSASVAAMQVLRVRASALASGSATVTMTGSWGAAGAAPVTVQQITSTVTNSPLNTPGTTDPCQNSSLAKQHAFATITTATTTALVAVSGTTVVYVCEIDFGITGTTTAGTVLFEQGTGVACASSPVALTATYTDAGTSITDIFTHIGSGAATAIKTAAANGLCAVTTVGTAPSIPVDVTYVQQ